MNDTLNIIYDSKDNKYVLLTNKYWKDALYISRIEFGADIDEDRIIAEIKKTHMKDAYLVSLPISGYNILKPEEITKTLEKILAKDSTMNNILKKDTTL